MTTQAEALKLALEALEFVNKSDDDCDFMNFECAARVEDAITAIKEALAQPEQYEKAFNDGVLEGVMRERAYWLKAQQSAHHWRLK